MRIVNIQRMSLHDGPGMRTTVFLKGCNLRCAWCHNPESQAVHSEIIWDRHKCIGCGKCMDVCNAHRGGMGVPERSRCVACGKCETICPGRALQLVGKEINVDFLVQELLKDRRMFEISGGGVTFSGGEPMLQAQQVAEAARRLKDAGIHVAIDTAGDVAWEHFVYVLPYVNMFLYDLKAMDCDRHMRFAGVSNRRILENLERLSKVARVVVRVPVIVEVNTDEAEAMASFLAERCSVERVDLLRYHTIGREKYRSLDREFIQFTPPDDGQMHAIQSAFVRYGICAAE